MTGRPWTKVEEALVISMTRAQFSIGDIAKAIDRTPHATLVHRSKMGAAPHGRWSPEKDARLRQLAASDMTRDQIAGEMGVVANTVSVHLKRLRIQRVQRISQERLQQISDMLARGRSRSTIARILGIRTSYVFYHVRKHGLIGPKTVVNIDVAKKDRDSLLLHLAGEGMSHTEIARRTETSATSVRSRLMTLALREEVIEANGMTAVRYVNRRAA